jgi:hypothetical protein
MQRGYAVHLSLDAMRWNIRAGFSDPSAGWNAETQRQYELSRTAVALAARTYAEAGFRCVIDDAIFPEWVNATLDGWQRELQGLRVEVVVLLPSLGAVLKRNAQREAEGAHRLQDGLVRLIHRMMRPWRGRNVLVIDNTDLSLDETAAMMPP